MSRQTNQPETQTDWEITPDGLYIATRHFLVRRGYCCANRCRNCPYINWNSDLAWQPVPAEAIRHTRVTPKALAAARAFLAEHEQELERADETSRTYHHEMIEHYRTLTERWK